MSQQTPEVLAKSTDFEGLAPRTPTNPKRTRGVSKMPTPEFWKTVGIGLMLGFGLGFPILCGGIAQYLSTRAERGG